jgi:hypothetical protein
MLMVALQSGRSPAARGGPVRRREPSAERDNRLPFDEAVRNY